MRQPSWLPQFVQYRELKLNFAKKQLRYLQTISIQPLIVVFYNTLGMSILVLRHKGILTIQTIAYKMP